MRACFSPGKKKERVPKYALFPVLEMAVRAWRNPAPPPLNLTPCPTNVLSA